MPSRFKSTLWFYGSVLVTMAASLWAVQGAYSSASPTPSDNATSTAAHDAPQRQTVAQAHDKSAGCESCHTGLGDAESLPNRTVESVRKWCGKGFTI